MLMTKPAGCALQLLSIPVIIYAASLIIGGKVAIGSIVLVIGLALLLAGRSPARQASDARKHIAAEGHAQERRTRRCPECAEDILAAARKCKHCGSSVTPE